MTNQGGALNIPSRVEKVEGKLGFLLERAGISVSAYFVVHDFRSNDFYLFAEKWGVQKSVKVDIRPSLMLGESPYNCVAEALSLAVQKMPYEFPRMWRNWPACAAPVDFGNYYSPDGWRAK